MQGDDEVATPQLRVNTLGGVHDGADHRLEQPEVLRLAVWPHDAGGFCDVVHAGVEEGVRALTKDPADVDWLLAKLTPQPMAVAAQPIELGNPAAAELPRAFVLFTEGRGTAAEDPVVDFADQLRSDPGWRVVEVADNHFAPINAPQLTAEALLSLV